MIRYKAKAIACRVSAAIISAGTPIAVIAFSPDMFFTNPSASVSAVTIMAAIVGAVSFKDTILKFFKAPNALKIWAIIFVLAVLVQNFAHQFMVLSAFALAAQGCCVPLNMLDKKYMKLYENGEPIKEVKANE